MKTTETIEISKKQAIYIENATHRYNIKMGATQSGKTFLDTRYLIPQRLLERKDKEGLNFIVGVTKETIERNVLSKMRAIWGTNKVSEINSKNRATLFGEMVYCIGAKDKGQAAAFRGATAKYMYIDEFPDISEEVFSIFSSRLSMPYSCADMTGNPKDPKHWSEDFIASDKDIYFQRYALYDNPFLTAETIANIERDYKGTVYFDRYVLGLPKRAEGIVFQDFADNPKEYIISKNKLPDRFRWCMMGYDMGGNKSHYGLVASALGFDNVLYVLKADEILPEDMKSKDVEEKAKKFIEYVEKTYNVRVSNCYIDDEYYTTINGLNDWRYIFENAARIKSSMPLVDRPIKLNKLMNEKRFMLVEGECDDLKDQLEDVVYDLQVDGIICDDGSQCIDVIDAFYYSIADEYAYLTD